MGGVRSQTKSVSAEIVHVSHFSVPVYFLYDLTLFPGFDLVACVFHKVREPGWDCSRSITLFSEMSAQNSRYKNGTTKACSSVFSAVPYRALQCDRCLVITT